MDRVRTAVVRQEQPSDSNVRPASISDVPGRHVGPYELIERIGTGGMGTVWKAQRADQHFDQTVAIKLIKRGMDTEDVLRRFRFERQVLATLKHPNIARVYDGGATSDDRPYLVMEFVDGVRLREYCQAGNLDVDARLQVFENVCAAVQHAHSHLVLHRDLKPSNILVTPDGTPKLLDFGIAKVLNPEGAAATQVTATEQRILTPRYASPEQIHGERLTTTSDVYALGVVLFELLTGESPHRVGSGSRAEVEQAVTMGESTRLSAAVYKNKTLPVAERRQLYRRVRGDLEAIVGKALEKEPARRYQSAQELAEDIHRHVEGLPLLARRAGIVRRSLRTLRRKRRGLLIAGTAMAMGLILSAVALTYRYKAPQWAEEKIRDAHQALLITNYSNTVWSATFFNSPVFHSRQIEPDCDRDAVQESLVAYDEALAYVPNNEALQLERDTVYLAAAISGEPVGSIEIPPTLLRDAPLTCAYSIAWARDGRLPDLTDEQLDAASAADLRCLGLLNMLCINIPDAIRVLSHRGEIEADPLIEALFGVLYLSLDRPERAYPRLLSAYRAYPDIGFLCTYLADAALQCGDIELCGALLDRAQSLGKQDTIKGFARVRMLHCLAEGDPDRAADIFEKESLWKNLVAVRQYAKYLFDRGDQRRALGLMEKGCGGSVTYEPVPYVLMREFLSLVRCYWTEMDDRQREDVLHAAFDEDLDDHQSLFRILGSYHASVKRIELYHTRPVLDIPDETQNDLVSPMISDDDPILQLCERLEIVNADRWAQFTHYPRDLRDEQVRAWQSADPATASARVDRAYAAWREARNLDEDRPSH